MPVELNSSIYKSPEDAKIAEVKGMTTQAVAQICAENGKRLFGI